MFISPHITIWPSRRAFSDTKFLKIWIFGFFSYPLLYLYRYCVPVPSTVLFSFHINWVSVDPMVFLLVSNFLWYWLFRKLIARNLILCHIWSFEAEQSVYSFEGDLKRLFWLAYSMIVLTFGISLFLIKFWMHFRILKLNSILGSVSSLTYPWKSIRPRTEKIKRRSLEKFEHTL